MELQKMGCLSKNNGCLQKLQPFTSSFDYTPSPPNLDLASALLIGVLINAHYKVVSELVQLSNNTSKDNVDFFLKSKKAKP